LRNKDQTEDSNRKKKKNDKQKERTQHELKIEKKNGWMRQTGKKEEWQKKRTDVTWDRKRRLNEWSTRAE
jgi:hypothetical protein